MKKLALIMLIKEGGRTLEELFTEEISLQGKPEEIEERFAMAMEKLPRSYEIINSTCVRDPFGYPQKVVLEFGRTN